MRPVLALGAIALAGLLGHLTLGSRRGDSSQAIERVSFWGGIVLALIAALR
jgi:hypothetical protein